MFYNANATANVNASSTPPPPPSFSFVSDNATAVVNANVNATAIVFILFYCASAYVNAIATDFTFLMMLRLRQPDCNKNNADYTTNKTYRIPAYCSPQLDWLDEQHASPIISPRMNVLQKHVGIVEGAIVILAAEVRTNGE